jgi:hypothetical protein
MMKMIRSKTTLMSIRFDTRQSCSAKRGIVSSQNLAPMVSKQPNVKMNSCTSVLKIN